MKQFFLFVFVFLPSFAWDFPSIENCPNAKNSIKSDKVLFECFGRPVNPCRMNYKKPPPLDVGFVFDVPEDVKEVLYEATLTFDSTNATVSGRAHIFTERDVLFLFNQLEMDLPLDQNGTVTVKLFLRTEDADKDKVEEKELDSDNPDYCVITNITIVNIDLRRKEDY